jgi:2-dehydropantoate 2-reductase
MAARICVVGCGALGSVLAAHLARAHGTEVYAYDVSQEHVSAIVDRGLRISGAANFTVSLNATCRAGDIPHCDFGIFAVKSIHTRSAIEQTSHIFDSTSAVCSAQNGLGNEEIIAEHAENVIRGATTMAAHLREPGHAGFEFYSNLWIGPFEPSGTPYARVEDLAAILNEAGLRVVPLQDARGAQWTKLIFNSAINPTGELFEALLREGESVAAALGIALHGDPREMIAEGAAAAGKRNPSMLMDVLKLRQTEVDYLNGAIADRGEELGVPVPVNRAIWALIKGLEHSWTDPS